jgi:hypothetical protein
MPAVWTTPRVMPRRSRRASLRDMKARGLFLLLVLVACSGKSAGGSGSTERLGTDLSCNAPPGVEFIADASASGPGCIAHPPGQICQVSNGATVLPDGGVSGGTETCSSVCAGSDYEMTCEGAGDPDPSFGCQVIPIPTPSDVTFYCCPCQ